MDQVLGHIDRIRDLYAHDPDVLRAMFVSTFEAMKTTSPLRKRVTDPAAWPPWQMACGRVSRTNPFAAISMWTAPSATSRPCSSASPSCGSHFRPASTWTTSWRIPPPHRPRLRHLSNAPRNSSGLRLHRSGETDADVPAIVPVQLAAPPLVQVQRALPVRHGVMPGPTTTVAPVAARGLRPAGRSPTSRRRRCRMPLPHRRSRPPTPNGADAGDHAVESENRGVEGHRVDPLVQAGDQGGDRTAQRQIRTALSPSSRARSTRSPPAPPRRP